MLAGHHSRRDGIRYGCLVRSRLVALAIAVLLMAPLAVAPASAQEGVEVRSVAIVTPASRTNQGWDQQGVDNLIRVGEELDVDVEVAENLGYDDITPVLLDLASDDVDLIVCHASGYQTVCPEFAAAEGVPVVVIENPEAIQPGLVADIETQAQEAAYLAGVMAGNETTSGTVGIVVTGQPPTWNFMTVGFAEGLKAARPDARLVYTSVGEGTYDDAAAARQVTDTVLAAGADIVFGMGDGAAFGMIQAIREHNQQSPGQPPVRFIDVIGDKSGNEEAADLLLTSVLFDYTAAYTQMIADLEAGTFGQVYTMDLSNGGVNLLETKLAIRSETTEAVAAARSGIESGAIQVSSVGDAKGVDQRLRELFPT
ncbi:MAG TPA: BMP family ABC transporter substrate-binding protein [Thermomicrobiales bacterium]|nr:BMP family ABC transporter substrate-binding protein [Thermomicrobiales bacterium]